MSIYTRGEPVANQQFRDNTQRNAGKMENVGVFTFVCKRCGRNRPVGGRKSLGWKAGFKCGECCK